MIKMCVNNCVRKVVPQIFVHINTRKWSNTLEKDLDSFSQVSPWPHVMVFVYISPT